MSDRFPKTDFGRATSRSLHIQALLQPERMQGLGFGFAMIPFLRRLYADPAERGEALRRHLAYFATHPLLAGFVLGSVPKIAIIAFAGKGVLDVIRGDLGWSVLVAAVIVAAWIGVGYLLKKRAQKLEENEPI